MKKILEEVFAFIIVVLFALYYYAKAGVESVVGVFKR